MVTKLGTAVVTGASTGIGAVYADRLAARGYDLILVARNADRLRDQAERLRGRHQVKIETFVADLATKAGQVATEELLKRNDSISMLVNNAGVASASPLVQSNVDDMQSMIELNVTALTRLAYAAVPAFLARGQGTIINISSVVAIGPELLNGVYGASKAYVLAFSQSLRKELADTGVRVQVVMPGATATDLWEKAGVPLSNLPDAIVMRATTLVDAALVDLDRGEFASIPSLHDEREWTDYQKAREIMLPHLSNANAGSRYARPAAE